ncbi:MAG: excinuclease ABC subunit UvrC [Clostridiales bacterium]|jgi:excinuclease ABC subunit C|nr:excinuclease ABC subunit UvrC [Clostridiales bacterium]
MNERLPYLREKTSGLTVSPGVYIMKDKQGKIIYIGKAKNLKNRVTSYFRETPDHTPKVSQMVSLVYDYDFIVTDTEYEALVLECSLIKQHKPKYNILLKDDKGYHYIKVSKEAYPKITAEKQISNDGSIYLGPYTSSAVTKQAVNEANLVFKLPTCKRRFPQEFKKDRPCLYYYISQCIGVCKGDVSAEEYNEFVSQAIDYIKSGSSASIERMQKEMEEAAENLDFERAAVLRDRISAISKASQSQKIFDNELKDTDVIALAQNVGASCVALLMYRNGRLFDKSTYIFNDDDTEEDILEAFIVQYYQSNDIPKVILIERELPNKELIEELLRKRCNHAVNLLYRQRGNSLKLIMLAKNNASEHLSLRVGRTGKEIIALDELARLLGMDKPPLYIEAYDISNLASTAMVAGMAVFENGRPLKSAYKRFSIKNVGAQNDYECMREVLVRRFNRYFEGEEKGFLRLPDLILVDGGKGHVNAVEPVLREMGIDVPVFGLVKDSKHRTRAIASSGSEISVTSTKAAFMLITKIQDEMHRFAISYQRSKHAKTTYELELTKIKGIGLKKAQKLLTTYKTKKALKSATVDEISKLLAVKNETAVEVYKFIEKL